MKEESVGLLMRSLNNIKGSAILCLAALIWGLAFVAQSQAADTVPPFIFNCLRSLIGSAFLFLLLLVQKLRSGKAIFPVERPKQKELLIGGLLCGVLLAISVNFQQFGLSNYPAGTASEARGGFLTALYVVLVPVISIFIGKKVKLPVWIAMIVATCGIYLLSLSGGIESIYLGDVLMFVCALSFSFHILAVDRYGEPIGGTLLSMLQFLVCGILSGILSLCFEEVVWANVIAAAPQILYLGIMSSGIAYTLQIYGQKYAEPAIASLSMSLESVFAALGGWLISGNTLTVREFAGCALVFVAIIVAQLPQFCSNKEANREEKSA